MLQRQSSQALSVFDYWDYKRFLSERLGDEPGARSKLAKTLCCQPAYLSRVLNNQAHLSAEQSYLVGQHFQFTSDEKRFFILLVQYNRAGTVELQEHFRQELRRILTERLELKRRVPLEQPLSAEHQSTYYSVWHYAAVHMALTLPHIQNATDVASYLGVSIETVKSSLNFLSSVRLIQKKNDFYEVTQKQIHLDPKSVHCFRHHTNWRLKAIRHIENERPGDFHYSSVISLSRADFYNVQLILTKAVEEIRKTVRSSREEHVACYNFDFFSLKYDA